MRPSHVHFLASGPFRQNSWLTGQTLPIIPVMPIVAIAPVGPRFGPAPLNCLQVDPQHAKQPLENPSRNVAPAHLLAHDGIGVGTFSVPRRNGTVRSSAIVRKSNQYAGNRRRGKGRSLSAYSRQS